VPSAFETWLKETNARARPEQFFIFFKDHLAIVIHRALVNVLPFLLRVAARAQCSRDARAR